MTIDRNTLILDPVPSTATTPKPRLTPRVYAPRPGTDFRVRAYRLRKALAGGARDEIKKAARDLTHDERNVVLQDIAKSEGGEDLLRAFWNPAHKRFDSPVPLERYNQRLDAPAPTSKPAGPFIAPMHETGPLRVIERGTIGHFEFEGLRRHVKVLKWGPKGVTAVDPHGNVFAVAWDDWHTGVHPDSREEHEELMRRREQAAVRKSMEAGLYAMTPEERVRFFAERENESHA